jgi:hypothetical protein
MDEIAIGLAAAQYHYLSGSRSPKEMADRLRKLADRLERGHDSTLTMDEEAPRRIFDYWVLQTKQDARVRFTDQRKSKVIARLAKYTEEEIKQAIRGCTRSKHHRGDNEDGRRWMDLELICRNDTKLEQFMSFAPAEGDDKRTMLRKRYREAMKRGDQDGAARIKQQLTGIQREPDAK